MIPIIRPTAGCLMGAQGWMGIKKTLDEKLELAPPRLTEAACLTLGGTYTLPPAAAEQTANITC